MDSNRSLIQVDPTDPESEDLREIQKTKFQEALRNLVTGKTPREAIFQRPIRGGAQVDYVPGWWFIGQLNALFGYLWDFEVLDQDIGERQIWVKGKLTVKTSEGVEIAKTTYGGSDLKFYKDTSRGVIDIGDDLKSAATDSLKKAATLLGLAADIYGGRELLEQTGPTKAHLEALFKIGESKGMSRDQVEEYCFRKHEKTLEELESVLVLGLIAELRQVSKTG